MILLPYILFEKYINILALEMASSGNQHCANGIGTLSLPKDTYFDLGSPALCRNCLSLLHATLTFT